MLKKSDRLLVLTGQQSVQGSVLSSVNIWRAIRRNHYQGCVEKGD